MYTLPNLPPSVAREVFANLCGTLPPSATDTAEAREMRDNLAMSAVAALHPADAFEALLAVTVVVADFYASDCLRLATEHRDDYAKTMRCRAQACAMMRQMRQTLRTLEQMQAARQAAIPDTAPGPSQRPQPAAQHSDSTPATRDPAAPPDPAPQSDALAQADAFAIKYSVYAAQIRFDRALTPANTARINPADLPTDPAVIDALFHGTSPTMEVLDAIGSDEAEAA
jgi:hypothetical protein